MYGETEEDNGNPDNGGGEKRRKRSTQGGKTSNSTNEPKIKKTNSASSVLGLNILLFQNESDYNNPPNWEGIVQNSYLGFKVR